MAGSRPIGYYGDWSLSFLDAGNEIGTVSGVATAIDGDDNSSNLGAQQGLWAAFYGAVAAIVLGAAAKREYYVTQILDPTLPTNGAAREVKLLTIYKCTATGKKYELSIPTLNPALPTYIDNYSVKDAVSLAAPAGITAYIAAFNAFVKAPDIPSDGDGVYAINPACVVIGLRVVGRNN